MVYPISVVPLASNLFFRVIHLPVGIHYCNTVCKLLVQNVGVDNLNTIRSLESSDDVVANGNVLSPQQQYPVNSEEQVATSKFL